MHVKLLMAHDAHTTNPQAAINGAMTGAMDFLNYVTAQAKRGDKVSIIDVHYSHSVSWGLMDMPGLDKPTYGWYCGVVMSIVCEEESDIAILDEMQAELVAIKNKGATS